MNTIYAVRALPVRDTKGAVIGWVRADLLADGTKPTDLIFLRDGSACGQADAAERLALDPSLLYPTRDRAMQEGIACLRAVDAADRAASGPEATGIVKPRLGSLASWCRSALRGRNATKARTR